MKRICVFCGSNLGRHASYRKAAMEMGHLLAARGIGLVYGGAKVGLMGTIADAVLEKAGHVIGIIPEALVQRELAHQGLQDLRVVRSMHERKALMADLSDGFMRCQADLAPSKNSARCSPGRSSEYNRNPADF